MAEDRIEGNEESEERKELEEKAREILDRYDEVAKAEYDKNRERETRKRFIEQVELTTSLGESLSNYRREVTRERPGKGVADGSWRLLFSGFLEGDFAERAHFPISLFGGFFLKTPYANILFDPGTGTRAGLGDMGVDVARHSDIIVVSHYHFSVRYDFHLTLNEMGAFRPDGKLRAKSWKIPFLSTEAVIQGRNDHPGVITPHYREVIAPMVVKPGAAYRIRKQDGRSVIDTCADALPEPDGNSLLLRTFPAYHDEVSRPGEEHDFSSHAGKEVCSYYLTDGTFGLFFTGDTEYREEAFQRNLKELQGKVDVLIANMKTIEYLPREERGNAAIDPENLLLTKNQLGFEGVKLLTSMLDTRVLVIRALGLECVVERDNATENIHYAPEKLVIFRKYLASLLNKMGGRKDCEIVIPIRHEIEMRRSFHSGDEVEIVHHPLVPAIPSDDVMRLGEDEAFVTANNALINRINSSRHILESDRRPFIVIQGETGCGKSFLAESLAFEIRKKDLGLSGKKLSGDDIKKIKESIEHFDLALAGSDKNWFLAQLLGCVKGYFGPGFPGEPGMLGIDHGVLILNQLEKLPLDLSKTFLDILEDWEYKPLSRGQAPKPLPVKVKIIFTTNEAIDNLKDLTEDLKNRLRGRCVTIPYLRTLLADMRKKERSLFIDSWCRRERVVLDTASWDLLLKVDLNKGALRCLRNLLEKARSFAEEKHAIYKVEKNKPIVSISAAEVEKAMAENGVGLMSEGQLASEKIHKQTAWTVAMWISYGCIDMRTYEQLAAGYGRSSYYFREHLKKFRCRFTSSAEAWHFFNKSEAVAALTSEGIEKYVTLLDVTDERLEIGKLFVEAADNEWLERRRQNLIEELKKRETKTRFLERLNKLA